MEEIIDRAVDAAWAELRRQSDEGKPGPYADREISVVDGEVDMAALVRAVLRAIRDDAVARQEGVDWAAEWSSDALLAEDENR